MNHDDLWREHGLCLGDDMDPAMWFPPRGGGLAAKQVCAVCPVQADCLLYSLVTSGVEHGVWGGAGDPIRRHLRRLLAASPHPGRFGDEGCDCEFCTAAVTHFARLLVVGERGRAPAGQPVSFGPRATHGRRSTYKRGCRCEACSDAVLGHGETG